MMTTGRSTPHHGFAASPATAVALAVADAEERIALELADTMICQLFGVGLSLESALPHVDGAAREPLLRAVDSIDQIIRGIRDVVFALGSKETETTVEADGSPIGPVRSHRLAATRDGDTPVAAVLSSDRRAVSRHQ
jgi:hypothetical protein